MRSKRRKFWRSTMFSAWPSFDTNTGNCFKCVRTKSHTPSSVPDSRRKRSSRPPFGLYEEITRSCFIAVGVITALNECLVFCRVIRNIGHDEASCAASARLNRIPILTPCVSCENYHRQSICLALEMLVNYSEKLRPMSSR